MSLLASAYQVLEILICLSGGVAALVSWRRFPGVSCTLLSALALRMLQLAMALLPTWAATQNLSAAPWQMLMLIGSVATTAFWVLLIVAIFGWRTSASQRDAASRSFQFSLFQLLTLMFVVGVLTPLFIFLRPRFFALPPQILAPPVMVAGAALLFGPKFIVCGVALWLAWTRYERHPQVSEYVGLGIGLQFLVALVGIAVLAAPVGLRQSWFFVAAPLASLASLGVLLVAALGWRIPSDQAASPSAE